MPHNIVLGELEQLVLLAVLRLRGGAYANSARQVIEEASGRTISRGALYRTLDRLETKGLLRWTLEEGSPDRGGHPRRHFEVTARGTAALRESRNVLTTLWSGLEGVLR